MPLDLTKPIQMRNNASEVKLYSWGPENIQGDIHGAVKIGGYWRARNWDKDGKWIPSATEPNGEDLINIPVKTSGRAVGKHLS